MAHSLRVCDDGVSLRLVSGQSSCLVHSLIQGPSWWCTHVSARKDSSEKDSGRLVISSLCWSPHWVLLVRFWWQHILRYWDVLLWDILGKQAWPRKAVWVHNSVTQIQSHSEVLEVRASAYELSGDTVEFRTLALLDCGPEFWLCPCHTCTHIATRAALNPPLSSFLPASLGCATQAPSLGARWEIMKPFVFSILFLFPRC